MYNNNLSNRLLYLPLDIQEKVFLWLTYKGLKPVSQITAQKRDKRYLRLRLLNPELAKAYPKKSYNFNSPNSLRIRKWISDAGLSLVTSSSSDTDWYVGRDSGKARFVQDRIRMFDKESQMQVGLLLGFPKTSVEAYVNNLSKSQDTTDKTMVGTGEALYENEYLKDKYYTSYILYNIPKDRSKEDSQVAKNWADTIRKDIPTLAKWFEKKFNKTH